MHPSIRRESPIDEIRRVYRSWHGIATALIARNGLHTSDEEAAKAAHACACKDTARELGVPEDQVAAAVELFGI